MNKLNKIISISIISLVCFLAIGLVSSVSATYKVENDAVYFYSDKIENADPNTFEALHVYWAKDKNNVYYKRESVNGVDLPTFEVINHEYGKDENNVYWSSQFFTKVFIIEGIDPATFEFVNGDKYAKDKDGSFYIDNTSEGFPFIRRVDSENMDFLGYGYSRDENYVYYKNSVIEGAIPANFRIFRGQVITYAVDENYVYCLGEKLDNSDSSTFEILNSYVAKDKNNVYSNSIKGCEIDTPDSSTFEMLEGNFRRDEHNVYYWGNMLEGADPKSFEVFREIYGKDDEHVYRMDSLLVGASPKEFQYLDHGYSKDNNNVYYLYEKIEGADPLSFVVLGPDTAKDHSNMYSKSKKQRQIGLIGLGEKNITNASIYSRLKGKIIIKVEDAGEAYYVNPRSETMHFLGRPGDAFSVMREQGVGITNNDLYRIPVGISSDGVDADGDGLSDNLERTLGLDLNKIDTDGDGLDDRRELEGGSNPWGSGKQDIDNNFSGKQKGKILLQVEKNGEAWYVNPGDGKRYFLGRPSDAFNVMRNLGLGISNNDFNSMSE